jgi:hypothetical protein
LNSRFIGIIAAQTLGERSTQLVLRTFHTSGSAIIKGDQSQSEIHQLNKKISLVICLLLLKLLHKFKGKTYEDIVSELFDVYDKDIYHIHFECVVAQLMWKNYRKWRLMPDRDKFNTTILFNSKCSESRKLDISNGIFNPKRSILQGILYEGRYSGVMDKILKG